MKPVHFVFASISGAGGSSLDPVLLDLLPSYGYKPCMHPSSPTPLRECLATQRGEPLYIWSHDGMSSYLGLLKREDVKFVFLVRDPRDQAISQIMLPDYIASQPQSSEAGRLAAHLQHDTPRWMWHVIQWLRMEPERCFIIRFEDVILDVAAAVRGILQHLNLEINETKLMAAVHRHSYEAITGRRRGEGGDSIRTCYAFRRGLPGDWKNFFDEETTAAFSERWGRLLVTLGYETAEELGCRPYTRSELVWLPKDEVIHGPSDLNAEDLTIVHKWSTATRKVALVSAPWGELSSSDLIATVCAFTKSLGEDQEIDLVFECPRRCAGELRESLETGQHFSASTTWSILPHPPSDQQFSDLLRPAHFWVTNDIPKACLLRYAQQHAVRVLPRSLLK